MLWSELRWEKASDYGNVQRGVSQNKYIYIDPEEQGQVVSMRNVEFIFLTFKVESEDILALCLLYHTLHISNACRPSYLGD